MTLWKMFQVFQLFLQSFYAKFNLDNMGNRTWPPKNLTKLKEALQRLRLRKNLYITL